MATNEQEIARELDSELGATDAVELLVDEIEPPLDLPRVDAERFAHAYRSVTAEIATIEAVGKERKADIDAWITRRTARPLAVQAWLWHALENFARNVVGSRTQRKFEDTAAARLKLTGARGSVYVRDPEAFFAWCQGVRRATLADHSVDAVADAVMNLILEPLPFHRTTYTPDKTEIDKLLTRKTVGVNVGEETEFEYIFEGETVPGIAYIVPLRDTFGIDIVKPSPQGETNA